MELYIRICLVLLGTLMYSIPRFHECRKLEGYKFPVYSTEFCPRNETEWNKRSSALNCNETNGYTCLPNEQFTELLEFCYTQPRIWIEPGLCLVLVKNVSLVHGYKCNDFIYGCPSSSYLSTSIFDYPTCIFLSNGCFLAEPTCKRKKTNLQDTSDHLHLENVTLYKHDGKTTPYQQKTTPQIATENVQTNNINIWIVVGPVLGALFLFVSVFFTVFICLITKNKTSPFQKEQICQWKRENSDFFSTKACEEVQHRIKSQRVIIVIGHPGTGKSAIIQHIALHYKTNRKENWTLKPLQSIMDFKEAYSDKTRTIFVINDPFGKRSIKTEECDFWSEYETFIKGCLTKSRSKLLMTCRKHIFLNSKIKHLCFNDRSCVVDINEEFKLTKHEKMQILSKYTNDTSFADRCAESVKIEAFFPQLCKLYREKKDPSLFLEPVDVLKSELMCLRSENKELFCALILLAIPRHGFCMEYLQNMVCSEQSNYISQQCGITNIIPYSIIDMLKSMDGFLVKKKESDNTDLTKDKWIYVFHNEVIQKVFESCFKDIIKGITEKV